MSNNAKNTMKRWGGILAALAGLSGVGGVAINYATLPTQIAAQQKRLEAVEMEAKTDHEMLIRIDENVKRLLEKQ